jgi:hypothetical protein
LKLLRISFTLKSIEPVLGQGYGVARAAQALAPRVAPLVLYNWQNSLTLAHFKPWPRPNTITFNQKGGFLMMHVHTNT